LQNCLGCEAVTEYNVATKEEPNNNRFYALEESSFCCRLCFNGLHEFKMTLSEGAVKGGKPIATYHRPFACPLGSFKCCCYQSIEVANGETNVPLGTVKETCYSCVPEFDVRNETGVITHFIHMPICFGCCPNICAEGCCRIPFYIYTPTDREKHVGKIVKIWGSFTTELFGMHQFECDFPPNSTPDQKAVLSGATFLLNELYFKRGDGNNNN